MYDTNNWIKTKKEQNISSYTLKEKRIKSINNIWYK